MIHFITMALGGEGYLNFMGNEVNAVPQILLDKLRSQFTNIRIFTYMINEESFIKTLI